MLGGKMLWSYLQGIQPTQKFDQLVHNQKKSFIMLSPEQQYPATLASEDRKAPKMKKTGVTLYYKYITNDRF